jgi:hypothetical protein
LHFDGSEVAQYEGSFQEFTPNGEGLIVGSRNDGSSRLLRFDGSEVAQYEGIFQAFSLGGRFLLLRRGNSLRLVSTVDRSYSLSGYIRSFAPNGEGLIIDSFNGLRSRLYRFDGSEVAQYEGSFQEFTPNGEGLITYSFNDNSSRLYRFDGSEVAQYEGSFQEFTPNGDG